MLGSLCFSVHRWLDSSKTLYEQEVKEHDVLYLRFKYYSFMDIDPRVSSYILALWCANNSTLLIVTPVYTLCNYAIVRPTCAQLLYIPGADQSPLI